MIAVSKKININLPNSLDLCKNLHQKMIHLDNSTIKCR